MNTSFPVGAPTSIQHARALTLRTMGQQSMAELEEVVQYDNADGFDLNPAKGEILISAAGGESQSDIAMSVSPEGQVTSADIWVAPGAEGVPFEKFSYRNDNESGTVEYSFEFNGQKQTVRENAGNGTITAEFA